MQKPIKQAQVVKTQKPFKWRRFIRHSKKNLLWALDWFIFIAEAILIQLSVVAAAAITAFFYFQSFTYFIVSITCFALLYSSHILVMAFHWDTVQHFLFTDDPDPNALNPIPVPQLVIQPTGCWEKTKDLFSKCGTKLKEVFGECTHFIWRGLRVLLFVIFSLSLLDLPVWLYQFRRKKSTEDYQHIFSFLIGFFSILCYIPMLFASCLWMINNPKYTQILGIDTTVLHALVTISVVFLIIGAVIGQYYLQFFKKDSRTIDSIFWGLIRIFEITPKVFLFAFIFKHAKMELMPLTVVGVVYIVYALGCTLVFTAWKEHKTHWARFKGFLKAFILNLYARILYLSYKETPSLQHSLTAYILPSERLVREEYKEAHKQEQAAQEPETKAKPTKKKQEDKRILITPKTWNEIMLLNNPDVLNSGFTRRAYTHSVHALRFIENFNLMLFCICLSIQNGTMVEYVEPEHASLYYIGRPVSALFTMIMFAYYVAAGIRTVYYTENDVLSIDE